MALSINPPPPRRAQSRKPIFQLARIAGLVLGCALLSGLNASPSWARDSHAVLIGASTYPALDEKFWLKGPANDIDLVQNFLLRNPAMPFARENIHVLADGVPGGTAPTLQAIRDQFAQLTQQVAPGDFVYLHFSGHGSQAPALSDDSELDGLDELFLPVDIGPWNDQVGQVENALVDDEIGQMITGLRQKGADVWVVFDSCHSGTATRAAPMGADPVRMRQLPASALGVPDDTRVQSRALPGVDPRQRPQAPLVPADTGQAPDNGAEMGRLVAFFAAQTNETTPEKNMPPGKAGRRLQGVFTYILFETLAERPQITYRQLGQEVLRKYATRYLTRTTPMFEGDLDTPVFGQGQGGRVLQWAVARDASELRIPAGQLHGVEPGNTLALLASPADPDTAALAQMTITRADTFNAWASPGDIEIPPGAVLRKLTQSVDFSLRVALPDPDTAPAKRLEMARQIIHKNGLLGPRIEFVAAGAPADLRLAVLTDSPRPDALWFLPGTGQIDTSALSQTPSVSTQDKSDIELAETMADNLRRMSRALNLLKLGATAGGNGLQVTAELATARFDPDRAEVIQTSRAIADTANVPRMIPNDVIGLNLTNNNPQAVDFNVLYIGSDYSVSFMGNGRLQPGGTLSEDYVLITDDSFGRDRMVVILSPAGEQSAIEDLSFLEQTAIERSRATAAPTRSDLAGMLDEAGFGTTTRAAVSLSSRRKKQTPAPVFLQFEIDTLPGK